MKSESESETKLIPVLIKQYQILRNVKRQHDSQYNCLNKIIINRLLYSVMYTMERYCTSLYCIENPYWTRRRIHSYNFNPIKNNHLRHVTVHYFPRIVHYVREVTRWFFC